MKVHVNEASAERATILVDLDDYHQLRLTVGTREEGNKRRVHLAWKERPSTRHSYGSDEVQHSTIGHGLLNIPEFTVEP